MTDMFDISGKTAVVTGGRGVLGSAMVKALAGAGASVAIVGRNIEKARKVAAERGKEGGRVEAFAGDVLDKTSLENAGEEIRAKLGSVDILINAAGGNSPKATTSEEQEFFDLPVEGIRDVIDLNFTGTVLACQVFGRDMADSGEGVIINISSMSAVKPLTRVAAYSAAKAAIDNFTRWLAVHMSQNYSKSIRVNAIAPGFFLTEQNRFLLMDKKTGGFTARGQSIIDHTPMGRFGEADELAGTLLWLVSPSAKFVHGSVVPVDGGFSAFGGI